MRIDVRFSAVQIASDIRRIRGALHHLETEMRTRGGQQGLKRILLGQMHYEAYGDQAGALLSDCLRAILETRELKKIAIPRDGELLENLNDAAAKLGNCCEEFSRTCFYIARLKGESLQAAEFAWGSRVWDRYRNLVEKYQESSNAGDAPRKAETGLQRGFIALPALLIIALQVVILAGIAVVGYRTFYPAHPEAPIATTTPAAQATTTAEAAKKEEAAKTHPIDPMCVDLQAQLSVAQQADQAAKAALAEEIRNPPPPSCNYGDDRDVTCMQQHLLAIKERREELEAAREKTSADVQKIRAEISVRCP